jgi:hypothetical protein
VNIKITKREKIVLGISAILCIVFGAIPQRFISEYECFLQVFIIIPLALLILTDPERREKNG